MVDPLLHTSLEAYSAIGVNRGYALVGGVVFKTSRILFAVGRRERVDSNQRAKCNLLLPVVCTKRVAPMRLICGMFDTHIYVALSAMRYYYAAGERCHKSGGYCSSSRSRELGLQRCFYSAVRVANRIPLA